MGYNVIDLINKAISISIKKKDIYENIGLQKCDIPTIKIVTTILIKQIEKTIQYYETLKKDMDDGNFEEIDFGIYDRISFLINEFNEKVNEPQIDNVKNFLAFSLGLEKKTYDLFIAIQGRIVKHTSDIHTKTYITLSNMINNKADLIRTLEKIIK